MYCSFPKLFSLFPLSLFICFVFSLCTTCNIFLPQGWHTWGCTGCTCTISFLVERTKKSSQKFLSFDYYAVVHPQILVPCTASVPRQLIHLSTFLTNLVIFLCNHVAFLTASYTQGPISMIFLLLMNIVKSLLTIAVFLFLLKFHIFFANFVELYKF